MFFVCEQVHRIKENCTQQVEWIRESYTGQIKQFKDFREFGTSQITSIRGQYYDQVCQSILHARELPHSNAAGLVLCFR
jgi:hypothetical protein